MAYGKRETKGVATLADIEALREGHWSEVAVHHEHEDLIRVPPFEDVALRWSWLWRSLQRPLP
ncbi:hypothetical protein SAMN05443572_104374 [Myxococcus fulvus]|uniref:Uncharacterized protein n=1 Tax=Myxococcus fulvus TaxID=33 RepID=A0A511SZY5_MYXFU|nr:hypothetical protein [Myxococcus fulvus]GEN07002.1 hypothetical protein MFU01_20390 [Myxococcus fulvus]SEU01701.1 hypothetical protein SAMN05443572_104374 [Myxococcus fulvus]